MPSDQLVRAVEAINGMPVEELPYLEMILRQAILRSGANPGGIGSPLMDTQDLAQKSADTLRDTGADLTGWEMALLAGVMLQYGTQFNLGMDEFESRQVTGELRRYTRTLSNITSAMDSLVERELVEVVSDIKKRSHKSFRVTPKGRTEAMRIWRRSAQEKSEPESSPGERTPMLRAAGE